MCSADTYCQFSMTDATSFQLTHTVSSVWQMQQVFSWHILSVQYDRCNKFSADTYCQFSMTDATSFQLTHTVSSARHRQHVFSRHPVQQMQHVFSNNIVRSCVSDTVTNIYDSNVSLQTQPEQLTFSLGLEPRACQVQSSTRAHRYLLLQILIFVSLSVYE